MSAFSLSMGYNVTYPFGNAMETTHLYRFYILQIKTMIFCSYVKLLECTIERTMETTQNIKTQTCFLDKGTNLTYVTAKLYQYRHKHLGF